jgi:hypothetical protein
VWTYVLTDLVVADMLAAPPAGEPPCDALLVTNGDNFYFPSCVPALLKEMAAGGHALVASHFVSHYDAGPRPQKAAAFDTQPIVCGSWRSGVDAEFVTQLRGSCIDLGALIMRVETVRRHGLRFVLDASLARVATGADGSPVCNMACDGAMAAAFVALGAPCANPKLNATGCPTVSIIRRVLFAHQ